MFKTKNILGLVLVVSFALIAFALFVNPKQELWHTFEFLTILAAIVFYLPGALAAAAFSIIVGLIKLQGPLKFNNLLNFVRLALTGSLIGWYAGKQKEQSQFLSKLSLVDRLTGLYNYSYFIDRLSEEKKRADRFGSRLSLIMLDLDYFKPFNDKFGHQRGNELLKQVSKVIQSQIRAVDIAVRYGGEEFALLLPNTGKIAAQEVAERIRIAVSEAPMSLPDLTQNITISAGVATYPVDAANEVELIDKADEALYQAKESGRNQVVVCQEEPQEQATSK